MARVTTIKIFKETKDRLNKLKEYERESYDEVLKKILFILNTCRKDPEKAKSILEKIDTVIKRRGSYDKKDNEDNLFKMTQSLQSLLSIDLDYLRNIKSEYRDPESLKNPFFVIVHARNLRKDNFLIMEKGLSVNPKLYKKVAYEIFDIRLRYDHQEMDKWPPQTIIKSIPLQRIILVCGFFRDICVKAQWNSLRINGYEAYISDKGTY